MDRPILGIPSRTLQREQTAECVFFSIKGGVATKVIENSRQFPAKDLPVDFCLFEEGR
jgi:hypothetical protein